MGAARAGCGGVSVGVGVAFESNAGPNGSAQQCRAEQATSAVPLPPPAGWLALADWLLLIWLARCPSASPALCHSGVDAAGLTGTGCGVDVWCGDAATHAGLGLGACRRLTQLRWLATCDDSRVARLSRSVVSPALSSSPSANIRPGDHQVLRPFVRPAKVELASFHGVYYERRRWWRR
jgi:hypothetical protein